MKTLRHSFILLSLALLPSALHAQRIANSFKYIDDVIPEGWTCASNSGDLNKDGIDDIVAIFYPSEEEKMPPILAIYWGRKSGRYQLWMEYHDMLPGNEDDSIIPEYSVEVTKKGCLKINHNFFAAAGSWTNTLYTHLFRFQNGDFFLIGKEEESITRNTGDLERVSYNYLTGEKVTMTSNVETDKWSDEKRTTIPKQPLVCLSDWKAEP